jgi:hypothetical protein
MVIEKERKRGVIEKENDSEGALDFKLGMVGFEVETKQYGL